jgi:hypothetical protein
MIWAIRSAEVPWRNLTMTRPGTTSASSWSSAEVEVSAQKGLATAGFPALEPTRIVPTITATNAAVYRCGSRVKGHSLPRAPERYSVTHERYIP